ncbi:hypothetical protein SAMN05444157_1153 [Frankineae bacterium MT45]|nr:hypothetical protein SAMN05444157_1153 [Frankineae bacterium MT45]
MSPPATDPRPGLALPRLSRLVVEAVQRNSLDLSQVSVLTEAATGPYVVTPVLAALAGAEVIAVTRASRYGSVEQVRAQTLALAESVGVASRITITDQRDVAIFAAADVVTNSGHLRPITAEHAEAIRASAVMPLMFEAWEIQAGRVDIDLAGLHRRGVQLAGTNERHPHVDVFSFLGPMAVAQLADAGVSAYLGRIAVLCDNPFLPYLEAGLRAAGATVWSAASLTELLDGDEPDAVIVSLTPTGQAVVTEAEVRQLAARWPTTVLLQYWGDIDRSACTEAGLPFWPLDDPGSGHMGVLPSRVGPEPIVRLQAGGLKVAQVLLKPAADRTAADLEYLDPLDFAAITNDGAPLTDASREQGER